MYTCIVSFTDTKNRIHYHGSEITHEMYLDLPPHQRVYYRKKYQDEAEDYNPTFVNSSNYFQQNSIAQDDWGSVDSTPNDISPDSHSFNGFGDGDTGGGGATADWDISIEESIDNNS